MTGVNEILNLKDSNTLQENTLVFQSKSIDLEIIAERIASDCRQIILMNRLPKLDCKKELNPLMDPLVVKEMQKKKAEYLC